VEIQHGFPTTVCEGVRAARHQRYRAFTTTQRIVGEREPSDPLCRLGDRDRSVTIRREGEHFRDLSFPTISGAGSNGAIVHYRAMPAPTASASRTLFWWSPATGPSVKC